MKKVLYFTAALVLALVPMGCTDAQGATDAVEAYGLTNVQTEGHAWFGCSKHDNVATKFTATNIRGQRVEGVVCSDVTIFGKADTVRITGLVR